MKTLRLTLIALGLLPAIAWADGTPLPWDASAQAPTAFAVPLGHDAAVMAQASALLNGWKDRDSQMYPMPIRASTPTLIQTYDPTAIGLFGVKITDAHTAGVALITVETTAYEGKIFEVSREHRDAAKRAHLLAYFLEQFAGVATAPPSPPAPVVSPAPPPPAVVPAIILAPAPTPIAAPTDTFAPTLQRLRAQLDGGQYDAALATIDSLRAAVTARQAEGAATSK